MTSADESLFKYDNQLSHSNFSFPNFVPKFLDEANETLVAEAKQLCGDDNNQCIFDYVFTGNKELALETNTTEAQAQQTAQQTCKFSSGLSYTQYCYYIYLYLL